jgi:hypothetical protein
MSLELFSPSGALKSDGVLICVDLNPITLKDIIASTRSWGDDEKAKEHRRE